MTALTYDYALPALVEVISAAWGPSAVINNLFLRDAVGRLTFVLLDFDQSTLARAELTTAVNAALGTYADPSGISVATPADLFDESLLIKQIGLLYPIKTTSFDGVVRVVDRRVIGADWLRAPNPLPQHVPRLFFVSLKGGVGRSTALCVLAAHLATTGRRVLAFDLDLEAPGLGSMLLNDATMPAFGMLDYLVESNLGVVSQSFIDEMIGFSPLAGGRGVIAVIPAFGTSSARYPENILAKIARAYLSSDDKGELGFSAKVETLLEAVADSGSHDVVLIDARAGLHESTAAAAVSLSGHTLLFGMDQPQTYVGYRALFSQLAITIGSNWPSRLHLVEARVGAEGPSAEFLSNVSSTIAEAGRPEIPRGISLEKLRETFDVDWDEDAVIDRTEDEAPPQQSLEATYIFENENFRGFDPLQHPDRVDKGIYAAVFKDFLESCELILQSSEAMGAKDVDS